MSAGQTRKNKKSSHSNNEHRISHKDRAGKPVDAGHSRHRPNRDHNEEKLMKTTRSQPIGEFSDWHKQRG